MGPRTRVSEKGQTKSEKEPSTRVSDIRLTSIASDVGTLSHKAGEMRMYGTYAGSSPNRWLITTIWSSEIDVVK